MYDVKLVNPDPVLLKDPDKANIAKSVLFINPERFEKFYGNHASIIVINSLRVINFIFENNSKSRLVLGNYLADKPNENRKAHVLRLIHFQLYSKVHMKI